MNEYNISKYSKYSIKILNFIDNNLDINIPANKINYDDHKIITYLQNLIKSTYKPTYKYTIDTSDMLKIHDVDQYPLMYLYFIKLVENNLYDVPEIGDFYKFTKWYKCNQHKLNFGNIISKIKSNNKKDDVLNQIYELIYEHKGHRQQLHKILYENPFMPLDVQHYVESIDMKKYSIKSDDYSLIIFNPCDQVLNSEFIDQIIHIIYIMIGIAKNVKNNNKPDITLLLTTQKKITNELYDDGILCAYNINSGASIPGQNVIIWRKEEIYKVLIHELIHFFEFDFHLFHDGYDQLKQDIMKTYNISEVDCPNESYTECFAVIIHSAFVAYKINDLFSKVFEKELKFTLFQICKILSFYNITDMKQLGYKQIRQTTSVFSYFIIKGMLIFNIDKVFSFINNDIKQIKITDRIDDFNELIKTCATDEYFEFIQEMLSIVKKLNLKEMTNRNKFINKTMRMTAWQLQP